MGAGGSKVAKGLSVKMGPALAGAGRAWRGWAQAWLAAAGLVVCLLGPSAWAAHAYAQFGDIKYPKGFDHFDYVNPHAPKGGSFALVAPTVASSFDKYNPFTLKGTSPPGLDNLVFETLLVGDSDEPATAYGLLAEDVSLAADKRSVTFRLRPQARFQNGDPVLAQDVLYSYQMLVSKQASPQFAAYFSAISKAVVLDPLSIRFEFKVVDPELPLVVGNLPVFSHKWGQVNGVQVPFDQIVSQYPIASGPYRIGAVNFGRDITYDRDPHYWGANLNVRKGQYNFDHVTFRMYSDNVTAFEGFKAGEFDFIESYISKDWVRQYRGRKFDSGELVKATWPHRNAVNFQGFIFNTRRGPFQDPRVRQAIGLTMDFEWMNRQLFYGIYKRLSSYFEQSEYEATGLPDDQELALLEPLRKVLPAQVFTQAVPLPPNTSPPGSLRANLRRARDLLAQAGWTWRDGQLRNAAGEHLSVEFLDNSPSMGRVIAPMLLNLKKLGIEANYRVVDYAVYEKRLKTFDFDVVSLAMPGHLIPGAELRQSYHSSMANEEGSDNLGGVASAAIDALLERITAASSRAELAVAARALDRVLRHGYYAVPHWYSGTFRVAYRGGQFGMPAAQPSYYRPETWAMTCWWSR